MRLFGVGNLNPFSAAVPVLGKTYLKNRLVYPQNGTAIPKEVTFLHRELDALYGGMRLRSFSEPAVGPDPELRMGTDRPCRFQVVRGGAGLRNDDDTHAVGPLGCIPASTKLHPINKTTFHAGPRMYALWWD